LTALLEQVASLSESETDGRGLRESLDPHLRPGLAVGRCLSSGSAWGRYCPAAKNIPCCNGVKIRYRKMIDFSIKMIVLSKIIESDRFILP
jgi:hypothetical protein